MVHSAFRNRSKFEELKGPIVTQKKVLILIPARYESSRFPGKPLAKIHGKSMIQRVFENCDSASNYSKTDANINSQLPKIEFTACVVTDDDRIEKHVIDFGGRVVRVDDDVNSGTLRISLALKRFFQDQNFDLIINVQGDEPLLLGSDIFELAAYHFASGFEISTVVRPRFDAEGFENWHLVKAIYVEATGQCLYFSRASVPFVRDKHVDHQTDWYHHIGVYSFTPQALVDFAKGVDGQYEVLEKLEQLRALEMGMRIGAIKTNRKLVGIDTPEDLEKLEGEIKC